MREASQSAETDSLGNHACERSGNPADLTDQPRQHPNVPLPQHPPTLGAARVAFRYRRGAGRYLWMITLVVSKVRLGTSV